MRPTAVRVLTREEVAAAVYAFERGRGGPSAASRALAFESRTWFDLLELCGMRIVTIDEVAA